MKPPHHSVLNSLLDKQQFEACRTTVEDMITAQMDGAEPDDRELAHLHLFLCRALQGEHRHELASAKADIAAFLSRKLKDGDLTGEALFRAGFSYIQAGHYQTAVDRFTACLRHDDDVFKAKVLFNRGHAYARQGAHSFAQADFDDAIRLVHLSDPDLARTCRINLAWSLILLGELSRAEEELEQLSREQGSDTDTRLQLQIAHDQLHIAYLKGQGRDALLGAVSVLRQAGDRFPHVKARVGQTLLALSKDRALPEQGFTFGLLTKRLAGQAERLDIDAEASRAMQELEFSVGSDHLVQVLLRTGQLTHGALSVRRSQRRVHVGGVG